jgi:hypothetical protein
MSSVAPVAKTAGLSVEKTTALLGTLTDRGLDASTAGTGLRNIFLELSKEGMTFEEAMLQINSASDKNAASLALFGKRGATVGTILSETSVDVANLEAKLNDAGGAAKEMADKQLNTLNLGRFYFRFGRRNRCFCRFKRCNIFCCKESKNNY